MSSDTIDVVMPTYKPVEFLRLAIKSVLAQQGCIPRIILVDDASPLEYVPLLEEIAASYPVRLVRRENNGGVAAAHNTGIAAATTEFVAFLEHDDIWMPSKLALQVEAMIANPAWGMCYTGAIFIDADGNEVAGRADPYIAGNEVLPWLLQGNCIRTISSVIMRRECLSDIGAFDESFRWSGDYDLWLRIAASKQWQIGSVPQTLVKYRVHDGSWSQTHVEGVIREMWLGLRNCCTHNPQCWELGRKDYAHRCLTLAQLDTKRLKLFGAAQWILRALPADRVVAGRYVKWLTDRTIQGVRRC